MFRAILIGDDTTDEDDGDFEGVVLVEAIDGLRHQRVVSTR